MALYEDKYVRVTKTELVIKCYYFPTGSSLHVNIQDIQQVNYADQSFSLATKGWGMAFSNVWWACDLPRNFPFRESRRKNVTVTVGSGKLDKGFSVQDFDAFFEALRPLLPHSVRINAFLPYG